MSEWKTVKLCQFDRKGGGTPSTKVNDYWNGDIYWITSANIDDKNRITYNKKITELGLKNSSTNLIPKNSVILATRVGLGKVAVNEYDTAISQDCQGIICKDINPYYLMWHLKSIANEIIRRGQGTTINGITINKLNEITVKVPDKSTQEEIVSELEKQFTRLDESVASLKKVKQKLGIYRKSVLKAAFDGKFTDNFVYDSVKLSQFDRKGGGTPSTKVKEYWNGDIFWITSANIDDKNRITYDKKITESGLKNSSTNRIPKNSVILVTRVGLGKVAVNEWDTAISQDCQGIICKDINPYYLMWHLKSIANEIILKGQGTTINGITINTLNELTVKIPNRNTQNTIVQEIESRFSVIEKLEKTVDGALQKSEMLRKSILKSAFEGKRVP